MNENMSIEKAIEYDFRKDRMTENITNFTPKLVSRRFIVDHKVLGL